MSVTVGRLNGFGEAKTFKVYPLARLIGEANIEIDEHSIIDDFAFLYAPDGHKISIGRRVHVAGFVSISGGSVVLGDFSSVGPGSRLLAASDDFLGSALVGSAIPAKYRNVKRATITLGKHAVVGANCTILPGITIGEGACVAAGAVVTKDVPSWTIVGGTPAKFLKYRPPEKILAFEAQLNMEDRC